MPMRIARFDDTSCRTKRSVTCRHRVNVDFRAIPDELVTIGLHARSEPVVIADQVWSCDGPACIADRPLPVPSEDSAVRRMIDAEIATTFHRVIGSGDGGIDHALPDLVFRHRLLRKCGWGRGLRQNDCNDSEAFHRIDPFAATAWRSYVTTCAAQSAYCGAAAPKLIPRQKKPRHRCQGFRVENPHAAYSE